MHDTSDAAGWKQEGRRIATGLDGCAAVVVAGNDPEAAAHVALGIGRAQSRRRRVAIADLIGGVAPLQSLVAGRDPHGIADVFEFGISLARVGHPIDMAESLFVLPSGTVEVAEESVYGHRRWEGIIDDAREARSLLLLVADPRTPGFDTLVAKTNGAVAVGDVALRRDVHVLARARAVAAPTADEPATIAVPTAPIVRRAGVWAAAAAMLAVAAVGVFAARDWGEAPPPNATVLAAVELPPPVADSAAGGLPTPRGELPLALTAADSALGAAFAVEIVTANTLDGAMLRLREAGDRLPAATIAPVVANGALWYQVLTGAYREVASADSLLLALRRSRVLAPDQGIVVRAPLALLVRAGLHVDSAGPMVAAMRARDLPVYALMQIDGTARIYAGAFERPELAAPLVGGLRATGHAPVLVYRTGRAD